MSKTNAEMMTTVEKYCSATSNATSVMCDGCRISNLCEQIMGEFQNHPDALEVAYREVIHPDDGMGCENCLHFDREIDEYPCTECKFNKLRSDPAYETTPLLWTDIKFKDSEPTEQAEQEKVEEVKEETEPANPVNHPSHYNQGGMECIDEMVLIFGKAATKHFCLLNAWKYRARAMYKNGQEDMDKANWYLAKYKELTWDEYPN